MKFISPAVFAAAIACFFLPFAEITCAGTNLNLKVTGTELVFGSEYNVKDNVTETKSQLWALIPFVLGFGGILTALINNFLRETGRDYLSGVIAFLAAVCMIILPSTLSPGSSFPGVTDSYTGFNFEELTSKIIEFKMLLPYYLSMFLFIGNGIYCLIIPEINDKLEGSMYSNQGAAARHSDYLSKTVSIPEDSQAPSNADEEFVQCSCGELVNTMARFCSSCGKQVGKPVS